MYTCYAPGFYIGYGVLTTIKLKSKWIKDIHIKPDTLKLIEKKLGKALSTWAEGKSS